MEDHEQGIDLPNGLGQPIYWAKKTPLVHLSQVEMAFVETLAGMMHKESHQAGHNDKHGLVDTNGRGYQIHVMGAAGELAFCKFRGMYFEPRINTFKQADVGSKIQIRTSGQEWSDLIIRPADNPDHYYVLVVVVEKLPHLKVVGWIRGRDAQQDKWFRKAHPNDTRPAAWFVPQAALTHRY